ncbi:zf-HC2 domain-containing protein [bacterium]|nr:zf-HC2 domain-containing protein [bacterium]
MNCELIKNQLIEYLDGDLSTEEARVLEEHLENCPECSSEFEAFAAVRELLLDDGYTEPSPFYWTRFNARLMQRFHRPSLFSWHPAATPRLVPITIAAVLFVVGFTIGAGQLMKLGTPGNGDVAAVGGGRDSVVSLASKQHVASGEAVIEFADYSDTLRPSTFAEPTEGPQFILARSDQPQEQMEEMLTRGGYRD